jgi:RAD54-like protein 2
MMTPSVSISPVVPKKEPIEHLEYYTDSDLSDVDAEAEEALLHEKQMQQARKLSGVPKAGQKLAKGKDVVTISSSSESSDDDCIVLSDPSEVEETDNEDDPSNSGMHTNDRYNIPDEHGRVLGNSSLPFYMCLLLLSPPPPATHCFDLSTP